MTRAVCWLHGSSPRAWRQLLDMPEPPLYPRFISTCVETASQAEAYAAKGPVHLHVRGDSAVVYDTEVLSTGSSPRAWRQPDNFEYSGTSGRFISTCVETAFSVKCILCLISVHLHVRGDSSNPAEKRPKKTGSSPRAWRQLSDDWFTDC